MLNNEYGAVPKLLFFAKLTADKNLMIGSGCRKLKGEEPGACSQVLEPVLHLSHPKQFPAQIANYFKTQGMQGWRETMNLACFY